MDGWKSIVGVVGMSVDEKSMYNCWRLGSQVTDRLDRVPRGKEVRARVIESLHTSSQESRDKNSGKSPDGVETWRSPFGDGVSAAPLGRERVPPWTQLGAARRRVESGIKVLSPNLENSRQLKYNALFRVSPRALTVRPWLIASRLLRE